MGYPEQSTGKIINLAGRPNAVVKQLHSGQKDDTLSGSAKRSLDFYRLSPIFNMVSRKIGHMVAAQNWKVYVVRDPGMRRELMIPEYDERRKLLDARNRLTTGRGIEEVPEHPLIDLIDFSTESFTAYQIRQLCQVYYDILGECYLYLSRNSMRMPNGWYPVNPLDIEEIPEPGSPYYKITPNKSAGKNSTSRMVPARDMFVLREPNPSDPYGRGLGLGEILADELETNENAAKYLKAFFRNSARPDILITGPDINPAAARRLEARWLDRLRGVLKQFTPFFVDLPENAKVTVLDTAFQHGGVLELKNHERDMVLQVFGISPEVFGIISNSNKATSEEAREITATTVTMPRLEIWRQALQAKLVPEFDEKLIIDYDDPRPEQRERKIGAVSKMPWAVSINEIRRLIGERPLDGEVGNLHPVTQGVYFIQEENLSDVEDLGYQAKSTDGEFGTEGAKRRDRNKEDKKEDGDGERRSK